MLRLLADENFSGDIVRCLAFRQNVRKQPSILPFKSNDRGKWYPEYQFAKLQHLFSRSAFIRRWGSLCEA